MKESSYTQIRNFLSVIIGGTLSGLLIVAALIYIYGPTYTYKAENVLLSPEVLNKLWYNTSLPSTGEQMNRFSFQAVELLYFDRPSSRYITVEVPLERYGNFYKLVTGDVGTTESDELAEHFSETPAATLLIKASTNGGTSRTVTENFQQVHFSPDGDYYRVELKEEDKTDNWAYFTHKDIYNQAMKILVP